MSEKELTIDWSPDSSWPFKKRDIRAVLSIIEKYQKINGSLPMLESVNINGGNVEISIPPWLIEINQYISKKYSKNCNQMMSKVLRAIFTDMFNPVTH